MSQASTSKDQIRYDLLVQEALLGVVRKVIGDAARHGLPGEHHFYVSFKTGMPGVRLSNRLRDKYPDEMTIVLQHQFWDLAVTEHSFEVGLSFSGIPERLLVPFEAITGFFDPSVQFGLKFNGPSEYMDQENEGLTDEAPQPAKSPRPLALATSEDHTPNEPRKKTPAAKDKPAKAEGAKKAPSKKASKPAPDAEADQPDTGGAQVVSLDAFRKKS